MFLPFARYGALCGVVFPDSALASNALTEKSQAVKFCDVKREQQQCEPG
jgi:hypothetical protein